MLPKLSVLIPSAKTMKSSRKMVDVRLAQFTKEELTLDSNLKIQQPDTNAKNANATHSTLGNSANQTVHVIHAQTSKSQLKLEKHAVDQNAHRKLTKMDHVEAVRTGIILIKKNKNAFQKCVTIDQE